MKQMHSMMRRATVPHKILMVPASMLGVVFAAFALLVTVVVVSAPASATTDAERCPNGFALSEDGASCYQLAQTTTVAGAATCTEGTLTPSGTQCWVPATLTPQTRTDVVAAIPAYACPDGATLLGGTGEATQCLAGGSGTVTVDPIPGGPWTCPSGSTAVGGSDATLECSVTVTTTQPVDVESLTGFFCPTGTVPAGGAGPSLVCALDSDTPELIDAITVTTYSCPAGTTASTGEGETLECEGEVLVELGPTPPTVQTTWACPAGATQQGGSGAATQCVAQGTVVVSTVGPVIDVNYSCPAGTSTSGSGVAIQCSRLDPDVTRVDAIAIGTWSCPAGTTSTGSGSSLECFREVQDYVPADVIVGSEWQCPAGAAAVGGSGANLECSSSSGTSTTFVAAVSTVTYSCPVGAVEAGGSGATLQCTGPASQSVPPINDVVFSCPAGSFVTGGSGPSLTCGISLPVQGPAPTCPSDLRPFDLPSVNCYRPGTFTTIPAGGACPAGSEANGLAPDGSTRCFISFAPSECEAPFAYDPTRRACVQLEQFPVAALSTSTFRCPDGAVTVSGFGPSLRCEVRDLDNLVTVAPVTTVIYSCPEGSLVASGSGATLQCFKVEEPTFTPVPPVQVTTYTCEDGARPTTGSGATLRCEKPAATTSQEPVAPVVTTTYSCPDGSVELSGSGFSLQCGILLGTSSTVLVPPVTTTTYSCPDGATVVSGGASTLVCGIVEVTTATVAPISTMSYACPEGSITTGGSGAALQCELVATEIGPVDVIVQTRLACPANSLELIPLFGDPSPRCQIVYPADSTTEYFCPTGATVASGSGATLTCERTLVAGATVDAIAPMEPTCPAGAVAAGAGDGLTCSIEGAIVEPVAAGFECPEGFDPVGSGDSCSRTIEIEPLVSCSNGSAPQDAEGEKVCLVGAPTTSTTTVPNCPRGVLSANGTFCLVDAAVASAKTTVVSTTQPASGQPTSPVVVSTVQTGAGATGVIVQVTSTNSTTAPGPAPSSIRPAFTG